MKTKTLADKTTARGRRYKLQARGKVWDVIWQDSYSWKYQAKAIKTEAAAREYFEAVTL